MGCFFVEIPEILDFLRCMVFLDVLDKLDASLSRFSVLRPIGRTNRASLQFSVLKHKLCVHTVFGIATDVYSYK